MNDLILIESVSARNEKIQNFTQDSALEHLNKAKSLVMAMWQGTGIATTQQMADYYEVTEEVVRKATQRNKEELESDGLRKLSGKDLKTLPSMVCDSLSVSSNTPSLIAWTPRAALRLGMLLRDSEVAKSVRTLLLDIVSGIPQQNDRIRELELQLELAQTNERLANSQSKLLATVQLLETVSPGLAPLALGKADAVVERVEYVERIIDKSQNRVTEGVGIGYLTKRFGFKNNQQTWQWLDSIGYGKMSGKWELQLAAIETPKLPKEELGVLARLMKSGIRQTFLGEN